MIVKVLIKSSASDLNKVFDYLVKVEDTIKVEIGKRVKVSFGKQTLIGVIVKICDNNYKSEYKLKYISEILDDISYIDESKLKLAKYMAYIYFCNVYDVLKLMMPPINVENYVKNVVEYIVIDKENINKLIENKTINSPKQLLLFKFLLENEKVNKKDIISGLAISNDIIKRCEKNGYLNILKEEVKSEKDEIIRDEKKLLTEEQKIAVEGIINNINKDEYTESLLFGVTGSGKTEVYLQIIEEVLNKGKKVIVLVPEISLTPQTVNRFRNRFGDVVSFLHSKMSIPEKKEEYKKIINGSSKIIIGARSAIFCPVKNLGLIVIDEEHDTSYLSEQSPKYDTKDVARYICKNENISLLLGSATPSICDYYLTENKKIYLFTLTKRPTSISMPEVKIVDKKLDKVSNTKVITKESISEIEKNLQNKEKTIIFLNKRGFSSYLTCNDCGSVVKCKNCDVAMTYHKNKDLLLCHYCSYVKKASEPCYNCGGANIFSNNMGTQRLEEELLKIFPNIKILRMDRDSTIKTDSHEEILDKFKNEDYDVLIGTQMVAKGHDIHDVTLVIVLEADSILSLNEYYSSERAYQTISQVLGRSGRGNLKGRTIVESINCDDRILNFATKHDYISFYNSEIEFRKIFNYPPFTKLLTIEIKNMNKDKLMMDSSKVYDIFLNNNDLYKIYSPKAPYIEKVNNYFRINILIKCNLNTNVYRKIYENLSKCNKLNSKISLTIR